MSFSVDALFEVPPKSVIYLGHIAMTNKEKVNPDDQASGAPIPIIDQAVTGFGNPSRALSPTCLTRSVKS